MAETMADRQQRVFDCFYRTRRAGQSRLSDGGGPFGFDIHLALIVDELIEAYGCDAVVETGCFLGDTTSYLARQYPHLPVLSCDVVAEYTAFTTSRLRLEAAGAVVVRQDSPELVARACARFRRPLLFLDAHWERNWPLEQELAAAQHSVIVIHDFDVGHPRFAFDRYDGVACGPELLASIPAPPELYAVPNPGHVHPFPCLQTGRRSGAGITALGLPVAPLKNLASLLTRLVPLPPATAASPHDPNPSRRSHR
jgi:hypothetical protein